MNTNKEYPLNNTQLKIYNNCIKDINTTKYNTPFVIKFKNNLNSEKLKTSIIETIEHYPYLKIRITNIKNDIKQVRYEGLINKIETIEKEEINEKDLINEIKPFNIYNNLLFRFKIFKTNKNIILFGDFHKLICDETSLNQLLNDIMKIYSGKALDKEELNGFKYCLKDSAIVNTKEHMESNEFFKKELEDFTEPTNLFPNKNENKESNVAGIKKELNKEKFETFLKNNNMDVNTLFLAITSLNLNKFTFDTNTLINTIYTQRNIKEYKNTKASLTKTLPFVFKAENRNQKIKEYLLDINKSWKNTIKHHNYSYELLNNDFTSKKGFSYNYYNNLTKTVEIEGETYPIEMLPATCENNIVLNIYENKNTVSLELIYDRNLYTENYMNLFLEGIETILNQIILGDTNNLKISDISLNTETKYAVKFNKIKTPILNEKFEKQVEETPDKIALIAEDGNFTYEELNKKANRIANALIKKGVKPKNNILVMLPRDSNLIATILGILKTGSAFIPLDLDYPKDRIKYIYENSNANQIIINDNVEGTLNVYDLLKEENIKNPTVNISPEDLAYMIYTSGSTGKPKGVMIRHKNITNLFEKNDKNPVFNLYSNMNKILALTTVSFDAFLLDFMSLTYGLTMILANTTETKDINSLVNLVKNTKPDSFAIITPSRLLQYLESKEFKNVIKNFKNINLGGEGLPEILIKKIQENSNANIYNLYGPTEITIMSNLKKITDSNNITVGKSLYNYITEVRDIDGKLLPKGVMGELYIGGCGVAKGYYNNKEKTEEVFKIINNIPYYRSGDYAIEGENEEIEIKGRIDNQIKLRGLRIEIDEIINVITEYDNINDAVVTIDEINENEHLCAYFTSNVEIDIDNLKSYLQDKLTQYMIPTIFIQLDSIPQTPNGKLDFKSLPKPELKLNYVMPESETENKLHDLVSNIINFEEFGITDNLYTLGFTSLNLMKLNTLIYEELEVKLDITTLLNNPNIKNIAKEIDNAQNINLEISDKKYYPLSQNQIGIYYECIQDKNPRYNIPTIIKFDKHINPLKLKEAIIKTINMHPYLKMRIINEEGELKQKRMNNIEIDEIEIIKKENVSSEELNSNIKRFNLEDNQLFRFKIYDTLDEVILFSDFHHIITDGVSQDNLIKDLASVYDTGNIINKEVIDGYIYSLIEEENKNSEKYIKSKEFFAEKFAEGIESTVLTPNKNGNYKDGKLKTKFKRLNTEVIKNLCMENGISPNVLFMAITILNLNKFTFNNKTLITTIFNGRTNHDYQNTQGMLVKTLPILFNNENRELTVDKFLKNVDTRWKETLSAMHYPYTEIAKEYQLKPEFFYSYHDNIKVENVEMGGKNYKPEVLDFYSTEYKFSLDIFEKNDIIALRVKYNDELYSDRYVDLFLYGIESILNTFLIEGCNNLKINDLSLREDLKDNRKLNPIKTPIVSEKFEKQVEKTSNKLALIAEDGEFTYGELNKKANRIANALVEKGVKQRSNILVMLPRDSNLIATLLGVLKTGSAFIPIDMDYPKERIKYIYENSDADYIITNKDLKKSLNINMLLEETNNENLNLNISPEDLAYIIYTSGSTGKPKGVMISNKNITNLFEENNNNLIYNIYTKFKKILATATVSFDVFLLDLMGLTQGKTLILANNRETKDITALTNLIKNTQPDTIAFMTPSRLLQYLESDNFKEEFKNIKYVGVGGEKLPEILVEKINEISNPELYNIYGPTEATVTSNVKKIENSKEITVGKGLYNYITEVRDIDGKLLPKGVMGELYIGGYGVSKGYYNNKKKTEEVFKTINNIPYYRSGDYAIEKTNGEIDIKGRIDNQIKLRGLRIELDEIKSLIDGYDGIKLSVIVIKKIGENEHLCAYYTVEKPVDLESLKTYLKNNLTEYMVPTIFKQIDTMPQTPNGKIDIKNLPEVELTNEFIPPENKLEQLICAIFSKILNIESVGACDNFFEIGGTSLIASKLIIDLINNGYDIEYNDIFENPTPRKLSNFLTDTSGESNSNDTIITDYDYAEINKTLQNNNLENYFKGESKELGNILLTGVTGYLGIHILNEYIQNETGKIYCLLRKGEYKSINKRFINLYNYYFNKDISKLLNSRIILVEGDITNKEDFDKFKDYDINTVINSAAMVKHYTYDDYIFKVNVDGVINGLNFAEKINGKYIQISTVSVGNIPGNANVPLDFKFDEKILYYGQDTSNKYVGSKFLAERMVFERINKGLDAKVIRVGNLMGRYSDGKFQKNFETNAFINNLKAIKNLGAIPYDTLSFKIEMSPIDYVAKSVLELSKTPKESILLHCLNDNFFYLSDLINTLNSFGDKIKQVDTQNFKKLLKDNMNEDIQGLITSNFLIGDDTEINAESSYTNTILHDIGIYWPVSDKKYLESFIFNLKNQGFFDK